MNMPKRLTDTEKWSDEWFMNLLPEEKLFFLYILDNCDHAGFWKVNVRLASFQIGVKVEDSALLGIFGNRIVELKDRWFIPKFIDFQYRGRLNPSDQVHKSVIKLLEANGIDLSPYLDPSQTLARPLAGSMVKVKVKAMVKVNTNNESFDRFWAVCTNKAGKIPAKGAWDKLTPEEQETAITIWPRYAAECSKRQISMKHPQGWLNDKRFNDQFESGRRVEMDRSLKAELKSLGAI